MKLIVPLSMKDLTQAQVELPLPTPPWMSIPPLIPSEALVPSIDNAFSSSAVRRGDSLVPPPVLLNVVLCSALFLLARLATSS